MPVNNEMNIYYPKMVANFQQKTQHFDSKATNLHQKQQQRTQKITLSNELSHTNEIIILTINFVDRPFR